MAADVEASVDRALTATAELLGYESLRSRQRQAAKAFFLGRDVFAVLLFVADSLRYPA